MPIKYVFVTGGVVSGLGKGITAASLGRLLKMRGYKVTSQKFDPYINMDPGTMNPIQHGEVFVTDDGAETDLDLGHYERFIDESLNKNSNVTAEELHAPIGLAIKAQTAQEIALSILVEIVVLYNWKKEFERFAPELSVCLVTGTDP